MNIDHVNFSAKDVARIVQKELDRQGFSSIEQCIVVESRDFLETIVPGLLLEEHLSSLPNGTYSWLFLKNCLEILEPELKIYLFKKAGLMDENPAVDGLNKLQFYNWLVNTTIDFINEELET